MTKTGPVHINKDPMMQVFGDALRLNIRLDTIDHHKVPEDVLKVVDSMLSKTNNVRLAG